MFVVSDRSHVGALKQRAASVSFLNATAMWCEGAILHVRPGPAPAASGQGPLPEKRVGFREMLLGRGLEVEHLHQPILDRLGSRRTVLGDVCLGSAASSLAVGLGD